MSTTIFEKNNDTLTVTPSGRLDTATSPVLEKEISTHLDDITNIIIDFKNIEYISSSGMRVILALEQGMEENNGSLHLINVNDDIIEIFELVGFMDLINVN